MGEEVSEDGSIGREGRWWKTPEQWRSAGSLAHLASQKTSLGCKNEQTATAVVSAPLQSLTMDAVGMEATSPASPGAI